MKWWKKLFRGKSTWEKPPCFGYFHWAVFEARVARCVGVCDEYPTRYYCGEISLGSIDLPPDEEKQKEILEWWSNKR